MAKIILHLKADDMRPGLQGWHLEFYRLLRGMAETSGIALETRLRPADIRVGTRSLPDGRFDDGNLHIIDDRSVRAANTLNAGAAYFWHYWQLDPQGVKAFSSTGDAPYDPAMMPLRRAEPFFENMRRRYLLRRRSKYGQPEDVRHFPAGAIPVFFQGRYPVSSGAADLTDIEMLQAVRAEAGDRPIIVKPHPKASTPEEVAAALALAKADDRLIITDANVHDILSASCATVSINSTVALEGFLHRKPAILFGKSDFHHFTGNVTAERGFGAALAQELSRDEGYEQFLAWYFLKMCLPLNSGRLEERVWEIFAKAGFPRERFS